MSNGNSGEGDAPVTPGADVRNVLSMADDAVHEAMKILRMTEEARFQPDGPVPCCTVEARQAVSDLLTQISEFHKELRSSLRTLDG